MEEPFTPAEDLAILAERIKQDLPYSVTFYNALIMHRCYDIDSSYSFFTLRNHPLSNVLLRWKRADGSDQMFVHCRESEIELLREALQKTHLINWQSNLLISHIPDYLMGMVLEVFTNKTKKEPSIIPGNAYVYEQEEEPQQLRCAPGLRVCRLGKAGVQHLLEMYKYSDGLTVNKLLDMTKKSPSAAVYPDPDNKEERVISVDDLTFGGSEEKPLAWAMTTLKGSIGMLMTEKGYQRRGLASLVMQVAAKMQQKEGYIPHSYVESDNTASVQFFDRLKGWRKTHHMNWILLGVYGY